MVYHGISFESARRIIKQGFRVWQEYKDGRGVSGGHLGDGIYTTRDWRIAHEFGRTILKAAISPGTRLLNTTVLPDLKTIQYLKREFGHEILRKSPWSV